jgi:methionine synthase II (cobalamin-independent)
VTDVARRLPAAEVVLQLDEPSLPVVLAGRVPTESGWQTLRVVEATTARDVLKSIVDAVPVPVVVHCCAADVPLSLIRATGAAAVALDLDLLPEDLDPLGETIEGGLTLFAGAVPTRPPAADSAPSSADVAARVRDLWRRLGFSAADLPDRVVVTTACGLAGAPADYARTALKVSVEAARRLAEE